MRSSVMIVAPFVAAAYAQSSAPANGTEVQLIAQRTMHGFDR